MSEPEAYSFRRYLEAKRSVDERAFNQRVLGCLQSELEARSSPLRVLEVGVGIGATIKRVATWDALPGEVEYTGVDVDPDLIQATRERLLQRSTEPTFEATASDGPLVNKRDDRRFVVELDDRDVFGFIADAVQKWDLLIGQAFLDLYEVRPTLSSLTSAMDSDGLLYLPITFDGGTILEPPIDTGFDDEIERRFHAHMDGDLDAGTDRGDSRAGRHLLSVLTELGGEVLATGGSDWVVVPEEDGYPADEAYFLHHIIETIRGALGDDRALDSDRFNRWVEIRHRQIEDGELVYIAHQLDVLCSCPP